MNQPIVVIGMGEMGAVFARGFLRSGFPVYPIIRGMDFSLDPRWPEPFAVVVAVAEKDLPITLGMLPESWKGKAVLLQNELLPPVWLSAGIKDPTVISVWFEKKKGTEVKAILPSPVFGPHADLIARVLGSLAIPCRQLQKYDDLLFALVEKNVFVLTINIAGLITGGTIATLWTEHRQLVHNLAEEITAIQESLTNRKFKLEDLLREMQKAVDSAPEHRCRGRAAPERLARTLAAAEKAGIDAPVLREISAKTAG